MHTTVEDPIVKVELVEKLRSINYCELFGTLSFMKIWFLTCFLLPISTPLSPNAHGIRNINSGFNLGALTVKG